LPEHERIELIKQLKRKWAQTNKECQNIVSVDTKGKIQRKEAYEALLGKIEKDIKFTMS